MRQIFLYSFYLFIFSALYAQNTPNPLLTNDAEAQKKWVDSIYNSMSLKEKVGQLFMVQVMSNQS
ncbi:hypothetical protein, partial [Seonamhaeicola marinus]